jgi:hypothetical protein
MSIFTRHAQPVEAFHRPVELRELAVLVRDDHARTVDRQQLPPGPVQVDVGQQRRRLVGPILPGEQRRRRAPDQRAVLEPVDGLAAVADGAGQGDPPVGQPLGLVDRAPLQTVPDQDEHDVALQADLEVRPLLVEHPPQRLALVEAEVVVHERLDPGDEGRHERVAARLGPGDVAVGEAGQAHRHAGVGQPHPHHRLLRPWAEPGGRVVGAQREQDRADGQELPQVRPAGLPVELCLQAEDLPTVALGGAMTDPGRPAQPS